MWTPTDLLKTLTGRRSLRIAAVLLALVLPAGLPATAAPQSASNPPASAEERADLRRQIERQFVVLPVSDGIALTPRQARAGIRTIEVTSEGVAVNGAPVQARTLRDWLGADADLVLRLQGISAAEQRGMFGLEESAAVPPEEVSAEPPAEQEVSEVDELPAEPAEPEEPAAPEEEVRSGRRSSGSRVNVGGSVTVDRDEVADEAVAVGGSVTVDGEVEQGVAAIGGPARINGKVGHDVVSVGSGVYLGPNSEVDGDVTSVGGQVHREPGAKVHGMTHEVALPLTGWHDWDWDSNWGPWGFWGGVSDVFGSSMYLVILGLLVCLVLLVAREPLERVDRQLVAQPWQSLLAGLASFVFFWPLVLAVTFLLLISVVGCALFLLYPFFFFFMGLLLLLGYAAVAYRLGRWIEVRFNRRFGGPYVVALVGVVLIQIWSIVADMLGMAPGPFRFFAIMVGLFSFVVQCAAWIVGFGAVILARFGFAPGHWPGRGMPVPVVPPVPEPSDYYPYSDPYSDPLASPATGPYGEEELPPPPADWEGEPPR